LLIAQAVIFYTAKRPIFADEKEMCRGLHFFARTGEGRFANDLKHE